MCNILADRKPFALRQIGLIDGVVHVYAFNRHGARIDLFVPDNFEFEYHKYIEVDVDISADQLVNIDTFYVTERPKSLDLFLHDLCWSLNEVTDHVVVTLTYHSRDVESLLFSKSKGNDCDVQSIYLDDYPIYLLHFGKEFRASSKKGVAVSIDSDCDSERC
jgi:hypothetical protein